MKSMIFAAGLGSRLKPITQSMPKAMVEVGGMPMIELLIRHFIKQGIFDIIINTHHFSEQIIGFILSNNSFGCNIAISDEPQMLLDTGGGLQKALWFFDSDEPFLVQNVDIMCDIDYASMLKAHSSLHSHATLAVSQRQSSRYLLFDDTMRLCGWENVKTGEIKQPVKSASPLRRFAFSGIHIISPQIFEKLTLNGKFSMIDAYLSLAYDSPIYGFEHSPMNWIDMGKPENVFEAEKLLAQLPDYF